MSFYAETRAEADEILREFGRALTLTRRVSGAYDTATGTATVTATEYSGRGAVFDYPARLIDGTHVLRGDKRIVMSAQGLSVVPAPGDAITLGDVDHRVIDVKALEPAGTVVLYTLQVRRGG